MADIQKILKGLLGEKEAEAVTTALDDATKKLDGAGVQRKEGEGDGETAVSDEAVLTALETAGASEPARIVKNVLDALKGDALTALEEKLGGHDKVVALLLTAIAGPPPEMGEPAVEGEMMKSLKDYIASTTKDMGELARSQVDIAKAMKDMVAEGKELRTRLEKLETQLNDRPRSASKAAETVVDDEKVKKDFEDNLGETMMVAGIRVKKDKY